MILSAHLCLQSIIAGDIVSLLMEKFAGQADNPLKDIDASADISEIYLFFDYDFHNRNLSLEEINRQIHL